MSVLETGTLARLACILEATARKPGNVHRFRDFDGAHYLDFLLSAAVIGDVLNFAMIQEHGVGVAVFETVAATQRVVGHNTNLGMVLLLAPLAGSAPGGPLRAGLGRVLASLTVADAIAVYQAIRLARPGGLGEAAEQDVSGVPTVTLREAMRLAADRDLIARQYVNDYAEVFEVALPALRRGIEGGRGLETAIIGAQLELMAACPDTLIARKRGAGTAAESSRRARAVLDAGWPEASGSASLLAGLDTWLREDGHARNPGTTADLLCAALYAALYDGLIPLPIIGGREFASGNNRPRGN